MTDSKSYDALQAVHDAYLVWRGLIDDYEAEMEKMIAGAPADWGALTTLIEAMNHAHEDWMVKCRPFIR